MAELNYLIITRKLMQIIKKELQKSEIELTIEVSAEEGRPLLPLPEFLKLPKLRVFVRAKRLMTLLSKEPAR